MGSTPSIQDIVATAIAPVITAPVKGFQAGFKALDPLGTERAKRLARENMDSQKEEQRALKASLASRQANEESLSAADTARRTARRRQLSLSTSGQSRQDTILTQGLGTVGDSLQRKTLLGS